LWRKNKNTEIAPTMTTARPTPTPTPTATPRFDEDKDGDSIDEELGDAAAVDGPEEVIVIVAELLARLPVAVAERSGKVVTKVPASSSKSDVCEQLQPLAP
jgi:hypothetical protein